VSLTLASSLLTALVSGVFALTILWRWWQRRRAHQLAWGIGMLMYFTGALSQVVLTRTRCR